MEGEQVSNDDYLTQTVGPLLYLALNQIAQERPPNPHIWLATYLLQNKDLVNKKVN